jgi:hypothetical protein
VLIERSAAAAVPTGGNMTKCTKNYSRGYASTTVFSSIVIYIGTM